MGKKNLNNIISNYLLVTTNNTTLTFKKLKFQKINVETI